MNPPLLISRDPTLVDELLRLAAAAGVTPDLARDPASALRAWSGAAVVLLGADLVGEVGRLAPTRREGVHVVSWGAVPDELFREALGVGAEDVTELPRSSAWVTELLTDVGDAGRGRAFTLGVLGGSGGAGATTFACALGQVASREGTCLVVDADVLGPGLDRVLGLDAADGVRWDALLRTTGRLSSRALREAVPRRSGLGVLTWRGVPGVLQPFAVREALSAAARGHDTVVVDLPRSGGEVIDEVVARCDLLVVLAVPTVAGLASATRTVARHPGATSVGLVLRGTGLDPRQVTRATGLPVIAEMGDQRGLAESIDLGLGPVRSRRGHLGRAAADVLRRTTALSAAA